MKWTTIVDFFRDVPRGKSAELKLASAYRNVFKTSDTNAQIVLADMADYTGFYRVNGTGVPPDDRAYLDGRRAAFGRLFHYLNLTDDEKAELQEAAKAESIASQREG